MRFLLALLGLITILFLFRVDSHAACYFGEGNCPPETGPAPPPTSRNPFAEEAGVELGASTDDLTTRFPNGSFAFELQNLVFRYQRRIDTNNGGHTDFKGSVHFDNGKVKEVALDTYADYYVGSFRDTTCTTNE